MNSKVDPAKVDGDVKQKVKFYGQQASDTMLRPEQVSQDLDDIQGEDGEDKPSDNEDSDGFKEDPKNIDPDLKEKAKFYKHKASDLGLRPEQVMQRNLNVFVSVTSH